MIPNYASKCILLHGKKSLIKKENHFKILYKI